MCASKYINGYINGHCMCILLADVCDAILQVHPLLPTQFIWALLPAVDAGPGG
jgi:hypothetical protein